MNMHVIMITIIAFFILFIMYTLVGCRSFCTHFVTNFSVCFLHQYNLTTLHIFNIYLLFDVRTIQ